MTGSPAVINAADGVRRGLEDHAVLRRADIGTFKLIFRRHLALDVFANLAVGLAQFLGDVGGELLIDFDDLQLSSTILPLASAAAAILEWLLWRVMIPICIVLLTPTG